MIAYRYVMPVLLLLSSCSVLKEANPLFCESSVDCTDSSRPFCDVDGQLGAEGVGKRCIAPPFDGGGSCETSTECAAELPICDPDQNSCRSCRPGAGGDEACTTRDAARPICDTDGTCVAGCSTSPECPSDDPICNAEGRCTTCTEDVQGDASCALRNETRPRCDTGACVGCIDDNDCSGTTPICGQDKTCSACVEHEQCPSSACDIDTGACIDAANVIHATGSGTDSATCGTVASPCRTISGAAGALIKATSTRDTIRLGAGIYVGTVRIDASAVRIIGEADAKIAPDVAVGGPGVELRNGATLTIDRVELASATGGTSADGVNCDNSTLLMRRSRIAENAATGIQATDCTITVRRSTVIRNREGGIRLTDSKFDIRNNFIVGNGGQNARVGGMRIDNADGLVPQTLEFNTIARNITRSDASASEVDCTSGSEAIADSNILWSTSATPPAVSGNCPWQYSLVRGNTGGTGNIGDDPLFKDALADDYHLMPASKARDAANESATVEIDFDGDSRLVDRRDMGADEISP